MKSGQLACIVSALYLAGCTPSAEKTEPAGIPPLTAEVRTAAVAHGRAIVQEAFGLLSTNLQTVIRTSGVSNALPYCSTAAMPLTDSVARNHSITLRRFSHKPRNPKANPDAAEAAILEQFTAALRISNNPPPPVVTNLLPDKATFFAPIILNNDVCLNCHGERGKDIRPENLAIIQKLYPGDQATGFRMGELRGAWRIDFPLAILK